MKFYPSCVSRHQSLLFLMSLLSFLSLPSRAAEEAAEFDRGYVGLSGMLLLPQGGSRLHRVGGAALRGGCCLTEDWAVEGEAAWLENLAGLSVGALGHLQGWDQREADPSFGCAGKSGRAKSDDPWYTIN